MGLGESDFQLGGLLIRSMDLELGTGEHRIVFDRPTLAPMEELVVKKSIGSLRVAGVGNANPATVKLSQNIGEMALDLRGEWMRDAVVSAEINIGELNVEPPTNAHVEQSSSSVLIGEKSGRAPVLALPEGAPTLELRLSGAIGEISVHDH